MLRYRVKCLCHGIHIILYHALYVAMSYYVLAINFVAVIIIKVLNFEMEPAVLLVFSWYQ